MVHLLPMKLLQHLEAMTSHRDTALLDKGVVTSLRELLGVNEVLLYDIAHQGDELLVALTAWADDEGVHARHTALTNKDYVPISLYPGIMGSVADPVFPPVIDCDDPALFQFIPILVGQEAIACCEIRHLEVPSRHKQYLASGVLALYRNYLTLLEDGQTDTLTGLANRKTFERSIARLLISENAGTEPSDDVPQERRNSASEENWLVIIDVDYFKQINDKFGHLYGDEILILLANLMGKIFRQNDQIFRFGGDEFVALLRSISYESASNTLERLRASVAQHILPQVDPVTITVGFSMICAEHSPDMALGHADEALYYAKSLGRNQVHCFERLIESGVLLKKELNNEAEFF